MMCISMLEWPNVYDYRWMTEYLDAVSHFGLKFWSQTTHSTLLWIQQSQCYGYSILAQLHLIGLNWSSFLQYCGIILDEKKILDHSFYLLVPSSDTIPRPSALFCLSKAFRSKTLQKRHKHWFNESFNMNVRWQQLPVRIYLQVCIRAWTLRKNPTSFLSFR